MLTDPSCQSLCVRCIMSENRSSTSAPDESSPETEESPSTGRWGRVIFWGLLLLVAAPSLLTLSGKHTLVLQWMGPEFSRAVRYRTARLHWWSPVEFHTITVRDLSVAAADQTDAPPLLTIASVRTEQPLWRLALSGGDGVRLRVVAPELNLLLADGQTNLEETLRRLFPEESSGDPLRYEVQVVDGVVHVAESSADGRILVAADGAVRADGEDRTSPAVPLLRDIQATISTRHNGAWPAVDVSAMLVDGPTARLVQHDPRVRVAARLDEVTADFPREPLTGSAADGGDRQPPFQLQITEPDENDAQKMTLAVRRIATARIQPLLHRCFPEAICEGRVSLRLQTRLLNGGFAGGLAGRLQLLGEDIRWRQTTWEADEALQLDRVSAEGIVAFADDGILLEGVRVDSSVLQLQGDGSVRYVPPDPAVAIAHAERSEPETRAAAAASHGTARLTGTLDLAAVSGMLPRTLGIREGIRLTEADINFGLRIQSQPRDVAAELDPHRDGGQFQWHLDVANSPVRGQRDRDPLQLDSVVQLEAHGRLHQNTVHCDSASLSGRAGQLTITPIEDGHHVAGQLRPDRLWDDLKPFLELPPPGVRGTVDVAADIRQRQSRLQIGDLQVTSDDLEVTSQALTVDLTRPVTEMLDGAVEIRGYSAAVKSVLAPWHDAWWLSDAATVAARLTARPGRQLHAIAVVKPWATGRVDSSAAVIRSGRAEARLIADEQTGNLHVEEGSLDIPGLQARLGGTVSTREDLLHVNLQIDTQYDLAALSRQFLTDDGSVLLTGTQQQQFEIQGSPALLTPTDLLAHQRRQTGTQQPAEILSMRGGLSWDGGRLLGTDVGPGSVSLELQDGIVSSTPVQCSLSGGQLNAMPRWRLQDNVIELASGARVSDLPLTQELAQTWLGYVSPLLAESTSVNGMVSLRLQQFAWSVDTPSRSIADGLLTIDTASAAAGPSLAPLISLLGQLRNKDLSDRRLLFPAQQVRVQLAGGVVQHDRLSMDLNGYQLATSGRVSLQEQVDLTLSIPLEKGGGRQINVPIRGTVRRPVPAFDGLLQSLGRQEIESRVNGELNRQLDKGLNRLLDKLR